MSGGAFEQLLPQRRATRELARRLAPLLAAGDLLVLSGELGAGKTFFVRALCRALGLPAEQRVTSPTFALVHEYAAAALRVLHADLYRLSTAKEVADLGLLWARDDGALLLVEWGKPFIDTLGGDALMLELRLEPRRALFTATGARSAELGRRLATALAERPLLK